MDTLHAPWRIQYIRAPKQEPSGDGSLFTRIAQSSDDVGHHVVARDRACYAVLNIYPYNGGHLMVVPYKETADLGALAPEELSGLMQLTRRCIDALKATMNPDGFNVGMNLGRCAGAGITEHLHIHIVPRWNGDTNFMPVTGQTRVLPEALDDIAARLRSALAATV
jgi:ATP adenylyltransferase